MQPLSKKQQAVLNYIADVRSSRGASPILREIAAAFSFSLSGAAKHVGILRKKGYLNVEPFAHRGIRLTSDRRAWKVRRERQSDFEKRIGSRLTGETDLGRIFTIVRDDLRAWIDIDRCDLLVEEPDRRKLRPGDLFGVPAPSRSGAAGEGPGSGAVPAPPASAATRALSDPDDPLAEAAFRRRRSAAGPEGVAIPVPGRDGPVGVLRLYDRRGAAAFDEVRMSRAETAADALGPALERARLDADLQRRIRMQAALIALCRTINAMDDLQRILHDTWEIVRRLVGTECGFVTVRDDWGVWWTLFLTDVIDGKNWEDSRIHPLRGTQHETVLREITDRSWYIKLRTPEEVAQMEAADTDVSRDGYIRQGNMKQRSRSFLYVPLKVGAEIIGYLSAQSYAFNAYSLRHAEDLAMISEYIGLAIQTAWRRNQERAKAGKIKGDLLDPVRAAAGDRALQGIVQMETDLRRRIEAEGDRVRDILQPVVDRLASLYLGHDKT